jgi:progressive ankylosis protein
VPAARFPAAAEAAYRPVNTAPRSSRSILLFWLPLAAQWVMMSLEGPFLAAVIARLADPTFNLAAYGVAFAFAILVESPVIMLMSASTALVEDAHSYRKMRAFAMALNVLSTALLLLVLVPPVFDVIMESGLGLPGDVADLVYGALWILLPWPAVIGYRRFMHGILIRSGRTRLVAYGTILRLASMAGTAAALAFTDLPGAWVGAAALSVGVTVEAIAARFTAAGAVREILGGASLPASGRAPARAESRREVGVGGSHVVAAGHAAGSAEVEATEPLDYRAIARFYYPLALTSLIGLTTQPILTFFMGRAPSPVESLAVFPVVNALYFLFSSLGLSYQEAAIALLGRRNEHSRELARFGAGLALAASGGLALIAWTPLAGVWFETVSGLPPDLAALAVTPIRVLALVPALSVVLGFQRAILVQSRTTRPITLATAIEVGGIALLFPLFGWHFGFMGVTAAALAFLGGRIASVLFLVPRAAPALRKR